MAFKKIFVKAQAMDFTWVTGDCIDYSGKKCKIKMRDGKWIQVNPATICRSLGILDKNKKIVFEEDILSCTSSCNATKIRAFYNKEKLCWDFIVLKTNEIVEARDCLLKVIPTDWEVIGNHNGTTTDFLSNKNKMKDFKQWSKEDFLSSYGCKEEEYDLTVRKIAEMIISFYVKYTDEYVTFSEESICREFKKYGTKNVLEGYKDDILDWKRSFKGDLSGEEIEKANELLRYIS